MEERGAKASVEHSCCCGQFMPEAGANLLKSRDCVLEMTQGGKALSILAKTPVSCLFYTVLEIKYISEKNGITEAV